MAKQAIKKKDSASSSSFLANFKASLGDQALKELSWITMSDGFVKATKLPGIPEGILTLVGGHTNTGKSSLVCAAIVGAQKKNVLPVIIDTEGNFSFTYARNFGMKAEPVYGDVKRSVVDPETGEVKEVTTNEITHWEGDFVYVGNNDLINLYGDINYADRTGASKTKEKRDIPVIEDVAECIRRFLNAQSNGELDRDILFIWDSVGSVESYESFLAKSKQNMRDAAQLKASFTDILLKLGLTRYVSSKYTDTMFFVNKVWNDNMGSMGHPTMVLTNGESLSYAARLIIKVGGESKSAISKLNAVCGGVKYNYGTETRIKIDKNQLNKPFNASAEGRMDCVSDGIIAPENLDAYKKTHLLNIVKAMNEANNSNFEASEVRFEEENTSSDE